MKLFYSPGACSLASHIALHELGIQVEHVRVDIRAKTTEHGDDYLVINPKGYVPALVLDDGEVLTENIALLDWIAQQAQGLVPPGAMGRTHLIQALAYISTEVHKSFKPYFTPGATDDAKAKAGEMVAKRLHYLADTMAGDYLLGDTLSTADCYLFVMLLWANKQGIAIPPALSALHERMMARPAVVTAMTHEGLLGG